MLTTNPEYAVETPIAFFRGNDWSQDFIFETDDVAIDLTGSTITASAKQGTTVIEMVVEETDLANGTFTVSLPRTTTDDMNGNYHYDIEVTDANDFKLTRIYGLLSVKASIPR